MGEEFKVQDEVEQAYRQGYSAGCNNDNRVSREDFIKACSVVYSEEEYNCYPMSFISDLMQFIGKLEIELFGEEKDDEVNK